MSDLVLSGLTLDAVQVAATWVEFLEGNVPEPPLATKGNRHADRA
jgi:hypothetical protein